MKKLIVTIITGLILAASPMQAGPAPFPPQSSHTWRCTGFWYQYTQTGTIVCFRLQGWGKWEVLGAPGSPADLTQVKVEARGEITPEQSVVGDLTVIFIPYGDGCTNFWLQELDADGWNG